MGTVLQLTLRVWVGFVGAVAIINGVKCQFDYDYAKTYLYMEQPDQGKRAPPINFIVVN